MTDRAAQQLGRGANHTRHVAGRVDHRVPLTPLERREPAVAVAAQLLDLGKELGVRLATVEERDLVAARERRLDRRAAEELRPAEDEQSHAINLVARRG